MKYDYFAFLKKEKFEQFTYNKLKNDDNLYFIHAKRDELWGNKPGKSNALYFGNGKRQYSISTKYLSNDVIETEFLKIFSFKITLTSSFFTASENKFYSIQNPIAKERSTGLPVLKGSSLKGALRQAAIDIIESDLLNKNYGDKFNDYLNEKDEEIEKIETNENDRFFFEKRAQLVRFFGNEKDVKWFTFKSLLATGGIKDVSKTKEILEKISSAFRNYLKSRKITDNEDNGKGRLIFKDLHFKKVTLDIITPLDREKRTPVHGPIFYEVVLEGETVEGKLIWFPFDLIANNKTENEIKNEWSKDKEILMKAFKILEKRGIGAKTKDGWERFKQEEM